MKNGSSSQLLLLIRGWLIIAALLLWLEGQLSNEEPTKPQVQRQMELNPSQVNN